MDKIKMLFEYQCYPMWVYNEKGELVDNDLVAELKNEIEIEKMLEEIQSIYDGLFEDNAIEFEYKGFSGESEKEVFIQKVKKVIFLIKEKIGDKYIIEEKINIYNII